MTNFIHVRLVHSFVICLLYMSDGAKRSKKDHNDPRGVLILNRGQPSQLIAAW